MHGAMFRSFLRGLSRPRTASLIVAMLAGCSAGGPQRGSGDDATGATGGSAATGDGGETASGARPATGGTGGTPAAGGTGAAPGGSGGSGAAGGTPAAEARLPARIRRLSNAEYDASVRVLLGVSDPPSVAFSFPPDTKQGPHNSPAGAAFTVNDGQRVDPVLADKLDTTAQALISEARAAGTLAMLAPCDVTDAASGEVCAKAFVESFGAKIY